MANTGVDLISPNSASIIKAELSRTLHSIQSSGNFAVFEQLESFVDPGLFVPGIGKIHLPLQEQTARSLVQTCHQAPFGKGEQTIIDTSVRNTWELNSNQFELQNPAWAKYVKRITRLALKELGFEEDDMFGVRAELYKLLLYEKGALFKPHKDSEKAPGMFGTLVICLPSQHEGGWVKLQHAVETKVFRTDLSNPSFACWYSDVVHEITQVTNGYRFVLTFNLTADPQGARPSAQTSLDKHDGLRQLLKQWQSHISSSKGTSYNRVIHLLDHEYTEQGLRLQSLKGKDLDVVRALYEACNSTGFLCLLASCEKKVYGECENDYGYSSRYRRYGSEDSDSYHDIVDVCDTSLCLNRIVDINGKLVAEGIDINEEEFLEDDPFKGRTPDDEDYSGYTGNEGVSATHWYRDSAIVLIPKTTAADCLMNANVSKDSFLSMWYRNKPENNIGVDNLFNYFRKLLEAEPDDPSHAHSLRKVCQKVLSDQTNFSQEIIYRTTEVAAQLGDINLLELAMSHQDYLTAAIAPTIGKFLSSVTLDHFQKLLTKPINALNKLHKRHEVIRALTTALLEERVGQPKQDVDVKVEWLASTVDELLTASDALEADDAKVILEMLNAPQLPNSFFDRLELIIQRNCEHTLFMVNFLAGLCQDELGERPGFPLERAISLFKSQFPVFYTHFDIPRSTKAQNKAIEPSESFLPLLNYLSRAQPWRTQEPKIAPHWEAVSNAAAKLPHIFRKALELSLNDQANAMLNVIVQVANTYPVDYFKYLFLPFLRGMLLVLNEKGLALSGSSGRDLYQPIMESYSRRYVGEKPSSQKDWARTKVLCPCRDCQALNFFIANPNERVGRFPMGKSRRMHIHQQLDKARGSYTHITERVGNPQTLVITKTRTELESKVKAWKMRRADAREEFEFYGLETLHELLGGRFQIITGFLGLESAGERGAKKQKIGASRSKNHHQTLSPNPHAQNVGEAATVGGAGTKRKLVQTIDLTGN